MYEVALCFLFYMFSLNDFYIIVTEEITVLIHVQLNFAVHYANWHNYSDASWNLAILQSLY